MESIKRLTAHKIKISDLKQGEYIKKSGWEPSYIKTKIGKISRVNIIGFIVGMDLEKDSMIIDDGTGTISLRFFVEDLPNLDNLSIGDLVLIIGRPRIWNTNIYLVPEIINKVNNLWLKARKLEMKLISTGKKEKSSPEKKEEVTPTETKIIDNPYEVILKLIKKMDTGDGAYIDEIIASSKIPNCEKIINNLIEEGEIFQLGPGKIKILD